jgi:hypothetical protein
VALSRISFPLERLREKEKICGPVDLFSFAK